MIVIPRNPYLKEIILPQPICVPSSGVDHRRFATSFREIRVNHRNIE